MEKLCQNGQWRARRGLCSNFSHCLTLCDICTCYAWLGLAMGQAGGKSKLATFGGSIGGDVHCVIKGK